MMMLLFFSQPYDCSVAFYDRTFSVMSRELSVNTPSALERLTGELVRYFDRKEHEVSERTEFRVAMGVAPPRL